MVLLQLEPLIGLGADVEPSSYGKFGATSILASLALFLYEGFPLRPVELSRCEYTRICC